MPHPRLRPLRLAAPVAMTLGALVTLAVPAGAAAAATTPTPAPTARIIAFPRVVGVHQSVVVIGMQFPAHQQVTIEECAQTSWIAPRDPCLTSNAVSVETTVGGWFVTVLRAERCPASTLPLSPVPSTAPRSASTCYLGEPVGTGVDVITLRGAVGITVVG